MESANVVGYLEKIGTQGYSLFTPTFADVGVDGMDIQKIKLVGSTGDLSDYIQTFTAAGALNPEYSYLTMDGFGVEDGWYDGNYELVTETIDPGKGFLFWNNSQATLNFSGEVTPGQRNLDISAGYSIMGNAQPVAIDIQDMKIINSAGDLSDYIQTFTAAGALNPEYSYLTMDGFGVEDGWYDSNYELVSETVQPGAAFLLWNGTDAEGMKLQLPSAY